MMHTMPMQQDPILPPIPFTSHKQTYAGQPPTTMMMHQGSSSTQYNLHGKMTSPRLQISHSNSNTSSHYDPFHQNHHHHEPRHSSLQQSMHPTNTMNTRVHTNHSSVTSATSPNTSSPLLQFENTVAKSSSPTFRPLLQPQHVVADPCLHALQSPAVEKLPNLNELMNGDRWSSRPVYEPQFTNSSTHQLPHVTSPPHYQSTQPHNHNSYRPQPNVNTNGSKMMLDDLERKLFMQEQEIRRLQNENMELRRELERLHGENSPRSSFEYSQSTASNNSPRVVETSPRPVKRSLSGNEDGLVSNSNILDSEECSKKRKNCETMTKQPPQSKKQKNDIRKPQQHPTRIRNSGRRDATVGDLEKYTVTWKGEKYVLVNAFKNRTQILNYYVPLFENNFPEKTCKLVLCNDEYKSLSSENPITVEKKKHAWRVSVFTMDFYNFVKNFDKKNLKIINSSAGFVPNIYFEEPQPSTTTSTVVDHDASAADISSSSASSSSQFSVNIQPTLVATVANQDLDTTPRPVANINTRQ
ncbi:hypothetical protein C9374_001774 [Naegleria lovaniensis]|uniref:Uncharacterized protein n=1 Tax=Naegleria lovaniensis TaxID=51637 RepID=A0AA88GRB4_NAELO|nr:uncharacterized protein C9374_001774 [Naegleria lovaniensis]KAG2387442.1 hypothetical protein C9374_001774 [Naegleria lovaniensis]